MIEENDAKNVLGTITSDLITVAQNPNNFKKLPDSYWGYFARGHDSKGAFGVIVAYSEKKSDIDEVLKIYETWVKKNNLGEKTDEQIV